MSTGGPTSTQTSGLPEYLQPYVSNVLQYAQQNVNTPYTAYTGPRTAEQSPMYSYGAELLANQTASPFTDMSGIAAAQGIDTLSGLAAKGGYIDQYGRPQTQAWEGDAATTQTPIPRARPSRSGRSLPPPRERRRNAPSPRAPK